MRTMIGIAVVVVIGLIWSVAAMSKWVPVNSADMMSVALSPHATTVGQGERPQAPARTKALTGLQDETW